MSTSTHEFHSRLGCSTISFRHQDLAAALATIAGLGFTEIDLGALPGVCDHVPYVLDEAAVTAVAATVRASGLTVRSINGDIGDLNTPLTDTARAERQRHLDMLVELAAATGSRALVLPCGALDHDPVGSLDADLDLVAAELTTARPSPPPAGCSCGPNRCTSTDCAATSNAHNNSRTAYRTMSAS